jgi:NAD(P)H-nitrite reductase large subunit
MRRYLIIGTGPAGIAAAEAIRSQDASGGILLFGEDPNLFYSRPGLAYYLTGEIQEDFLYPFKEKDYANLDVRFEHASARRIDPLRHEVVFDNGVVSPYDRLLIAVGAQAVKLAIPGSNLDGVVKLDDLEDAKRICQLARRAKSAVVIGGGITALEIVEGLVAQGIHVHYFLRGERYWSNVLDEEESRLVEEHLKEDGVEIHFSSFAVEILGNNGRVAGLVTKGGKTISCQIVGVAAGILPRTELTGTSGIKTDRGILVNEFMQTSAQDIYAAGDVAQAFDPTTGKYSLNSLWNIARQEGATAGLSMAGIETLFRKGLSLNVTRLAGLTTTIIGAVGGGRDADVAGINRGDSESWRHGSDGSVVRKHAENYWLRMLINGNAIKGALIMGNQELSLALQELASGEADISPIRENIVKEGADVGTLLRKYWEEWKRGRNA